MRLKLCCAVVAVALALTGCGDDSSSGTTDDQAATSTPQQTTTTEAATFENTLPKPRNPGPHPGARVDQLVVRDVRVGSGPAIQAGDTGVFDFIGTNWVTGRPLDASWQRRGRPFETTIERGVVIDGWWQGIPGMRVGGRRQIVVPPGLGFTQSLVGGLRGATTYFDIVLLEIRSARPEALRAAEQETGATG